MAPVAHNRDSLAYAVVDNWPYRNQIVEISPVNISSDTRNRWVDGFLTLVDGNHQKVKYVILLFNHFAGDYNIT